MPRPKAGRPHSGKWMSKDDPLGIARWPPKPRLAGVGRKPPLEMLDRLGHCHAVAGDGGFGNFVSVLQQFTVNARSSPHNGFSLLIRRIRSWSHGRL